MSRARLAVVILALGSAAMFVYQAIALDRKPLTVMGGAARTDEKWVLEMADALDELGKMGYSDGHGNRMAVGEGLRELVRKRRQQRLTYWSTAGVLALIGVVAVAKRRKAVSLMVGVFVLLTVGCAREETAWRTASETGTIQAYEEFLKRYPAGGFVGEAQTAITALSWEQAKTTHTQQAYQAFLKQFPKSAFEAEARTRSRDFVVNAVGTGEISLPGNEGQDAVRRGPILELRPQWATRVAKVNDSSSYATDDKGNRMSILYLVPVDLAKHKAQTEKLSGGEIAQQTWIPPVNTFTRRYNAFGTADKALGFVFEFSDDKTPVRFGLVYDKDYERIVTIHILDNVITLRP